MRRALLAFGLFSGFLGAAAPALAASDHQPSVPANEILTRAAHAVRHQNYRGVLIYLRSGQLNSLKVIHRYHNGSEQERLISLTGPAREVIRKGSKVTSILPGKKLVLVSQRRPNGLLSNVTEFSPSQMEKHYRVIDIGQRRLAGRRCRLLGIDPKDKYRYGYHMWVDHETRLPLKLALRNHGKVLEKLVFSEISFPDTIPDKDFLPNYDLHGYRIIKHRAIEMSRPDVSSDHWHVTDLPPGFEMAEDGVRKVKKNAFVRQMLFTDGVATVSAFIAPAGLRKSLKGASTMGAVNAYGRVVDDKQITVVGEVPAVTVKTIARHIERKHQKSH